MRNAVAPHAAQPDETQFPASPLPFSASRASVGLVSSAAWFRSPCLVAQVIAADGASSAVWNFAA
jgi:hypothetical protein